MSVRDLYQEACRTPSDISEHLPVLERLVVDNRISHVVELGVRSGNSTVALLAGLEQTGGQLTSVDIDGPPPIPPNDRWRFIRGDDCSPEVLAQIDPAGLVFIDTSHGYEHTRRELDLYHPFVVRPGWIVLHDTQLRHPIGEPPDPPFPVRKAVVEFVRRHRYPWRELRNSWGLAIIRIT